MMYFWLSASVVPTDDAVWPRFGGVGDGPVFDGSPLANSWAGLPVKVNPGRECNFMHFKPGVILCDVKAKDQIFPYVKDEVEFLPFDIGIEKEVFLINVINVIDALDKNASEIKCFPHTGKFMDVKRYAFDDAKVGGTYLFKIPLTASREILCTQRFYSLMAELGLSGLKLVPLPLS